MPSILEMFALKICLRLFGGRKPRRTSEKKNLKRNTKQNDLQKIQNCGRWIAYAIECIVIQQ